MTPILPGPEGPLQTALRESTAAAAIRATEGQRIFSPVAAFLDQHRNQTSGLPPHLQRALASLSDDLAAVAQRHFDAFISGTTPENLTSTSLSASRPPPPPPSRPLPGLAQSTYAAAASSPVLAQSSPTAKPTKKTPSKQLAPDNRLFVRLPNAHPATGMRRLNTCTWCILRTSSTRLSICRAKIESTKRAIHIKVLSTASRDRPTLWPFSSIYLRLRILELHLSIR
jgi:hypothetical protein